MGKSKRAHPFGWAFVFRHQSKSRILRVDDGSRLASKKEDVMKLKCSICKRKIDMEKDHAFVFECYVYCDKCLKEMERKDEIPGWHKDSNGSDAIDLH